MSSNIWIFIGIAWAIFAVMVLLGFAMIHIKEERLFRNDGHEG